MVLLVSIQKHFQLNSFADCAQAAKLTSSLDYYKRNDLQAASKKLEQQIKADKHRLADLQKVIMASTVCQQCKADGRPDVRCCSLPCLESPSSLLCLRNCRPHWHGICNWQAEAAAKKAAEATEAALAAEQETVEELRSRTASLEAEVADMRKVAAKHNEQGGLLPVFG